MARECINQCPRIQQCIKEASSNTTISALGHLPIGYKNIDLLRERCEASYDCPGPVIEPAQVVKGWFFRRMVTEDQTFCGLARGQRMAAPQNPIP